MIRYKGKGEHSVNELEQIIEQQNKELHQLKTEHNKCLNRLREQYKLAIKDYQTEMVKFKVIEHYNAMRSFCLDCELVSFNDIETMEYEVNNEVKQFF
jgi:hypothetical protein